MKVLVTGAEGRLGRPLQDIWPQARFLSRSQCDVSDWAQVAALGAEQPTHIVHLAAATDYNADPQKYLWSNIVGTAHIAALALLNNARLVFTSTVYVYQCEFGRYNEDDSLQPVGKYAWSKLGGEAAVRQVPNHLIIRGCWYDKLAWETAAWDAYSTRMPARQAAQWIKELVLSDEQGVINIGGPVRTLYDIVKEQNPNVREISRDELSGLPYLFPASACVDTTRATAFRTTRHAD